MGDAINETDRAIDEDAAIRMILEGTANTTGEPFFDALVVNLAKALKTHGAWVTEYFPETNQLNAIAFRLGDKMIHDFIYDVSGTACETVLKKNTWSIMPMASWSVIPPTSMPWISRSSVTSAPPC